MAIVKIQYPVEEDLAPENVVPLDAKEKRRLVKAAEDLAALFEWDQTVEGEDFWASVYERLHQIAENGELK
jgi:hypothetical protein